MIFLGVFCPRYAIHSNIFNGKSPYQCSFFLSLTAYSQLQPKFQSKQLVVPSTNHKAANKVIKCLEHDKSQQQSQAVHHSSYDYEFHKDFSLIDVLFMVKPCRGYTFRFAKTGPRGLHFPRTRVATLSCGIFRFATARLGHNSKPKLLT